MLRKRETFLLLIACLIVLHFYCMCSFSSTKSRKYRKSLPIFQRNVVFFKLKDKPLYIFSAYADLRLGHVVRLVGMASHGNYERLSCAISHSNGTNQTVPATVEYLPEGHNLRYDAIYVLCKSVCPLTSGTAVGLSHNNQFDFFIPLQIISSVAMHPSRDMTVCYPPLHSGYDNVEQFVENIEMNRILGFRQFFVYVHNVGPRIRRAITSYAKEGIVHVVSWEAFPLVSGTMIHYLGQMVAINDCLYRAMNNPFRVVAFHDFDELIIPHRGWSLSDIVAKEMGPAVSGLSVRCAMFSLHFADDVNHTLPQSKDNLHLLTQIKTKRLKHLFPHRQRSKMLVAADKVVTMGIHFVWTYYGGETVHLNADTALLHHYRKWTDLKYVHDRAALKYGQALKSNVKRRIQQLNQKHTKREKNENRSDPNIV